MIEPTAVFASPPLGNGGVMPRRTASRLLLGQACRGMRGLQHGRASCKAKWRGVSTGGDVGDERKHQVPTTQAEMNSIDVTSWL
jgi:hypothetical protein